MYNIKEVHYRDIYGKLIWKDNIVFRSLWGVGNELVHDSKQYIVRRVAVADEVQHVNIELVSDWSRTTTYAADGAVCSCRISIWSYRDARSICGYCGKPRR